MAGLTKHIPIMVGQVLEMLDAKRGGKFLDCTLGGAGHTRAILEANPDNQVTSTDRDDRALERARDSMAKYGDRFISHKASFAELPELFAQAKFDGVLADLGVSTDQLKENRGFSFNDDSKLDMRMDESQEQAADQLINGLAEKQLYVLLRQGGVGQEALAVARAIVDGRPIESTTQLARIVNQALAGQSMKRNGKKTNPATIVFQALRMAVNNELEQIIALMNFIPAVISKGSRLVVLTFHSLEDKEVAHCMRNWESGGEFSASFPGARPGARLGKMLTRKPIVPSAEEVEGNASARSARLRAFEFC